MKLISWAKVTFKILQKYQKTIYFNWNPHENFTVLAYEVMIRKLWMIKFRFHAIGPTTIEHGLWQLKQA